MSKIILTVDDAPTVRRMICLGLKTEGYEVVEAADGVEGIDLLKSKKVDLIISDINMPNMDGYEFTKNARTLPNCQKTPILILTTEPEPAQKDVFREMGASGWIKKPFNRDKLAEIVKKVIG